MLAVTDYRELLLRRHADAAAEDPPRPLSYDAWKAKEKLDAWRRRLADHLKNESRNAGHDPTA